MDFENHFFSEKLNWSCFFFWVIVWIMMWQLWRKTPIPLITQVEMANKIGSNKEELPVLDQRRGLNFSLLSFRSVYKYDLVKSACWGLGGSGRGDVAVEVSIGYYETLQQTLLNTNLCIYTWLFPYDRFLEVELVGQRVWRFF